MALLDIVKKGSTDRSVAIRIVDSGDGTPETGVVFNTSGIDLWYRREGEAKTSITEATLAALTTAHTDGGFLHVGDGSYRLDLPDAAFATGANHVDVGGTVTGMVVLGGRVRLVNYDPEDTVRLGLTALPNAAADAAGGLPISDAGGLDLDAKLANTHEITAARMGALTDWIDGGRLDLIIDAIKAKTDQLTFTIANKVDSSIQAAADFAQVAADKVWSTAARVLTAATNITSTGGTTVPQTGDSYAIVNSGTHGNAALKAVIDAIYGFLDTEIAAVLEDTSTTIDDLVDDLESRLTAALASKLTAHAAGVLKVVIGSGSTTTNVVLNSTTGVEGAAPSATADFYNGAVLIFTTGALAGQRTSVTDYTEDNLTVVALTGAPAEGVEGILV